MQKMMMFMPILFGFFLYNYAAGLSLYMITTSLFGVIEQTVIKKIWPIDDTEQTKKKSGFMSRLGQLQKEAQKIQEMKRKERGSGKGKGKGKGKGGGSGKGKKR
jgi:YidC/Oxa1 family membrane protein insertase